MELQTEPGAARSSFWQVFEPWGESRGAVLKRADRSIDSGDSFRATVRHGMRNLQFNIRCET